MLHETEHVIRNSLYYVKSWGGCLLYKFRQQVLQFRKHHVTCLSVLPPTVKSPFLYACMCTLSKSGITWQVKAKPALIVQHRTMEANSHLITVGPCISNAIIFFYFHWLFWFSSQTGCSSTRRYRSNKLWLDENVLTSLLQTGTLMVVWDRKDFLCHYRDLFRQQLS